jgi:dephospho-CoA kinase
MLQTILSIAGKPGLYKLVSRAKNSLIVEALDETHKRQPAFATDRVTSLADIAMFTESEDMPLGQVLAKVRDHEGSKKASVNWRKASAKELTEYFATVLPDYDRDRVHNSDIKKLLQWYDILIENGLDDFDETLRETEGDNIDDRK